MNNSFYFKLAISNLKKNSQTYIPYILTCIFSIMTFYIMDALALNPSLVEIRGGDVIKIVFKFGVVVIAVLSLIFLFYTNSFLIKRRKKEIGIYNILGMEKKHIGRVISFETIIIAIISLLLGILGGIIFGKLLFLILLKLIKYGSVLKFPIILKAIVNTIILFCGIFILILFVNVIQVKMNNPIELLKGTEKGEKEIKASKFMAILGVIELAIGYYMALKIKSPLTSISLFFIATIIVIIGTYTTFISSSIILLKLLKKNKKFYYKKNNFISVSGMIYRMKQNATGLASICILSSAVLLVLSATISLYVGQESSLKVKYPLDVKIELNNPSEEQKENFDNILKKRLTQNNVKIKNEVKYKEMNFILSQENNRFIQKDIKEIALNSNNLSEVCICLLDDYNKIENKGKELNDDEVILFSAGKDFKYENIIIGTNEFNILEKVDSLKTLNKNPYYILCQYVVIVKDVSILKEIQQVGDEKSDICSCISFDVDGNKDDVLNFLNNISNDASSINNSIVSSIYTEREDFYSLNGGIVFLGCFLGVLFIMATILIIYYKQISEGYDDSERFKIMQKVGLSKEEVKKTINKQVLMVFFIPPLIATIHIAFASKVTFKILTLLGLFNPNIMIISVSATVLIFFVVYALVYKLTANVYYKLVQ